MLASRSALLRPSPAASVRILNKRFNAARASAAAAQGFTLKSPFKDVAIPECSIPEHVLQISQGPVSKYGENVALKLGNRVLTYNQLKQDVLSFGAALHRDYELRKGDVIGMFAPNCPEYATVVHGSTALGVVLSTFNPSYTETELKHQLKDSGAKVMVTYGGEHLAKLRRCNEEIGSPVKDFIIIGSAAAEEKPPGAELFHDIVQGVDCKHFPKVKIDPDDVALLPYSSGTTGLPKGVVLTHRNIVANVEQCSVPELVRLNDETSLVGVLPFYHIYGQTCIMHISLSLGAHITCMERFDPIEFLRILQDEKVNIVHAVPPMLVFLAKHPMVDQYDITSVREIFSGAAPLTADVCELLHARFPHLEVVRQGYGMTETSPGVTVDPYENMREGTVGCIVPNTELRVLDLDTGESLPPNRDGEICVRGPQVMREYLNKPDATREMIDEDGFLHTGDVGYVTEDGHLVILDRIKELIKVKGHQVAPAELEGLLVAHPAVADACVVQMPDERCGEVPKAYVVLRQGAEPDKDAIMNNVNSHLAEHKHIKDVEFVTAIPKSPSGKILRRVLRELEREKKVGVGEE